MLQSQSRFRKTTLAAALLTVGIAFGAQAQNTAPGTAPMTPGAPSATTNMGKPATNVTERSTGNDASPLARGDRKFIEKAAQGGMAEVELGKLAQEKAASDQVKQFGKRMVDDHSKANDQLKSLASSKGVALPAELDRDTRREMDKLAKKSGADFDREYMKHMVSDHKKDVSEFKSESKGAKDADVRNFAASTLPTLEQHLDLAKATETAVKNEGKTAANTRTSAATMPLSTSPSRSTPAAKSTGSSS